MRDEQVHRLNSPAAGPSSRAARAAPARRDTSLSKAHQIPSDRLLRRCGAALRSLGSRARTWAALTITALSGSAFAEPSPLVPEVGHNYGEHETPRMTAMGGATRSTANSLSALYSNPANLAAAQVYHVGAFGQIHPEARRQSYGGAIVDSLISSSGLAGGLGGIWTMQDPDGMRREWMDLRFGLGLPLGDVFLLGLTGKYITLQQNGTGPLGFSEASGGLRDTNILQTVTFDAGATLRPTDELSIAVTGHNLTNPETTLLPLMAGVGVGYATPDFGVSGDLVLESRTYEKSRLRTNIGAEVLLVDRLAVRAGYRYDQGPEAHALSGGLGYVDPRYSIDFALRRGVTDPSFWAVVFGFTVHIESMGLGSRSPDAY